MSFLRHGEIYRSDVASANAGSSRWSLPPALIGLDEFPAGYSLAGCSPAGPASASPAAGQCEVNSSCRSRIFHRTSNSVLTGCLTPGGKRRVKRAADRQIAIPLLDYRFLIRDTSPYQLLNLIRVPGI